MQESSSNQVSVKTLVQAALRYLSLRIRSKQEMIDYLSQKTADEDLRSQTIQYLEEHQLIDDAVFTQTWINSRLRHGKGDKLIIQELHQKGIDNQVIQEQLEAVPASLWEEAGQKVLDKYQYKWINLTGYQQKAKMYQTFLGKGFSSSRIDAFLRHKVE